MFLSILYSFSLKLLWRSRYIVHLSRVNSSVQPLLETNVFSLKFLFLPLGLFMNRTQFGDVAQMVERSLSI